MTDEQIRDLLIEAYNVGRNSPDLSTKNGSLLITPEGEILAAGYNHIPYPIKVEPERLQRPLKYFYTEHAERSVIFTAGAQTIRTHGSWMVCPWAPCEDCARAIIMAGITKLIAHDVPYKLTRPDWLERVDRAISMLKEAGVEYHLYEGKVGLDDILFDGNLISV